MPEITVTLDDETDRLARAAAEAAGVPYGRWVADLIRARSLWPAHVMAMAGSAPNFPLREDIGEPSGEDVPRVKLAK
jgi:hypothetical protein